MPKFKVQVQWQCWQDIEVEAEDEDALYDDESLIWEALDDRDTMSGNHKVVSVEQIPEPPLVQLAREAKDED